MVADRVTVSLDEESRDALDALVRRTGNGQSAIVRRALRFYLANYLAAPVENGPNLSEYHDLLSQGDHVLLDVDFLHGMLDFFETDDGELDPEFVSLIDHVAAYHATEFEDRFEDAESLLEWLSFCGFLTFRHAGGGTYHVSFPTENVTPFMTRFIGRTADGLQFDLEIETGISKILVTERR